MPGEEEVKVELYKAVDGIKNESVRDAIYEIFKAHNETLRLALTTKGDRTNPEILKAEEEIEKKAQEYQKDRKIDTYEEAYSQFLDTAEGQRLWAKMDEESATA